MTRKRLPGDDPREWLALAKSNLTYTRSALAGVDPEDLCFEAQQAAEKAIKAIFVKRAEHFPYTHDLQKLLRLLEGKGVRVPKYVHESKELTRYAHVTRYPGPTPVTTGEHRRAVRIATAVLRWAERQITGPETMPKKRKK